MTRCQKRWREALIIVDVQNDFCPGGSLAVTEGDAVVPIINDLMHSSDFDYIIATRDWHVDPKGHFSDNPDYKDTWPEHCVAGSNGAEYPLKLRRERIDVEFLKGKYTAAYSGFEGRNDQGLWLEQYLRDRGVQTVFVCGLATDYCVKATALDAARAGFNVVVLLIACRGVAEETTQNALEEMRNAGVVVTDSLSF